MQDMLVPVERLFGQSWPLVWTLAKIIAIEPAACLAVATLPFVLWPSKSDLKHRSKR